MKPFISLPALFIFIGFCSFFPLNAQQKHIYLANDNHTDYFWSGNAEAYRAVALNEIGYYLGLAEATKDLAAPFQSRYNLDGAWYVHTYRQHSSAADFNRLLGRIRSGHFSVPFNFLVSTYGGQPTEAVLRGMYWAGKLNRDYDLDMRLAVAMENQTLPLGLSSLWAGSGAKYSWRGVCGCNSPVSHGLLGEREHEIYRYRGLDGSGVLMKWYSWQGPFKLGGYAEARFFPTIVAQSDAKCNTPAYPYNIVGAFGYGEDQLEATTDQFVKTAQAETNANRQIYVSNETDFFERFLDAYDTGDLPAQTVTFGNDWDIDCEAMAAVTAKVRNAVEKLRTAEALAGVVSLIDPDFYQAENAEREQAWIALGSYWEHNFGLGGCCDRERGDWQLALQRQLTSYADGLYDAALAALAKKIPNPSGHERFLVFNSLGWSRTGYADVPYDGDENIIVTEVETAGVVPHQLISRDGIPYLRILAAGVPSVGYKIYEIRAGTGTNFPVAANLEGKVFENSYYRLVVTSEGVITSLVDKTNGNREYAAATGGRYLNDFGQGAREAGTLTLLDNGPVSATIACTSGRPLKHTTFITLYGQIDRIDIENRISDNFGDEIRTYSFSLNLDDPTVWHEELGAVIKAKYVSAGGHYADPGGPVRYDWQTLNHFADVGGEAAGLTLSNRGAGFMKLGNSSTGFLDQNSSQINVLIGGRMKGSGPGFANQFGQKEFVNSFALRSRSDAFSAVEAMRFALEHQNPFAAKMVEKQVPVVTDAKKTLPEKAFSLLTTSEPNVLLWAFKPSEEGVEEGGFVLRLWNLDGEDHTAAIAFATEVLDARRATHLETDLEPAAVEDENLVAPVGRHQLATFRVQLDTFSLITGARPVAKQALGVDIFPNPAFGSLSIRIPNPTGGIVLTVYNVAGQQIATKEIDGPVTVLEVKTWEPGVYIFSFASPYGRSTRKVILK